MLESERIRAEMNGQVRSVDAARTSQAADEVGLHHRAVVAVIMTA
jgi:hypothetical protein